ncbi:PaaI family thioesterase [Geochorda subterranea]|uniref:PaaI family thioesterase n=1 Tax=Geochorda subterranea TaxID=3109564 RepID=A0ABZ1BQS0_9FIRM|nr:PaaI family thioesterase [Limnochorda sp. LNt]WRP15162.1 PaaI family thioesterase [Limnochorda sp. LNt]
MAFEYWTSACFVCGRENEGGLHARVVAGELGGLVQATLPPSLVGLPGIGHGGAVVALLDEAMWYAVYGQAGIPSLTAHLEVRFVRPAPPQVPLVAVARLAPARGAPPGDDSQGRGGPRRIGRAVARLLDGEGRLVAAARGRFVEVEPSTVPVHRLLACRPVTPDAVADLWRWPGVGAFLKGGE